MPASVYAEPTQMNDDPLRSCMIVGSATETADCVKVDVSCESDYQQVGQQTSSRAVIMTEIPIPRKTSQKRTSRGCFAGSLAPEATPPLSASVVSESGRLIVGFMERRLRSQ